MQFNRHLRIKASVKAWVKDEVKDVFRKALDREMVKTRVEVWVKAIQKCPLNCTRSKPEPCKIES